MNKCIKKNLLTHTVEVFVWVINIWEEVIVWKITLNIPI